MNERVRAVLDRLNASTARLKDIQAEDGVRNGDHVSAPLPERNTMSGTFEYVCRHCGFAESEHLLMAQQCPEYPHLTFDPISSYRDEEKEEDNPGLRELMTRPSPWDVPKVFVTPMGTPIYKHTCGTSEYDGECLGCGQIDCPEGEPLHYHHDGCPVCDYLPSSDASTTPEPERPAARCVWTSGWQVEPWSGTCGAYASYRPLGGWAYCPYCGQPLVVEAPHE